MSSQVMAAVIASGVSIVLSLTTGIGAFRLQKSRLREELRTEFMAEAAIRDLLLHDTWSLRSFSVIKKRVRGFEENELRQLLIRAGAICFDDKAGEEMWGLRIRNENKLR